MDEFLKEYTFVNTKAEATLVHGPEVVPLRIGETYRCKVDDVTYNVLIVNLEFKDKKFFSINVDLYSDRETLMKSDVYFYNVASLALRAARFPLQANTVANHVQFWRTLAPYEFQQHHTKVQFLRSLAATAGKQCRLQLAKVRDRVVALDHIKRNIALPALRVAREDEAIVGYLLQKNQPMVVAWKLHTGDKVRQGDAVLTLGELGPESVKVNDEEVLFTDSAFWITVETVKGGGGTRKQHHRRARSTSLGVRRSKVIV
jgi:hypothetical protein